MIYSAAIRVFCAVMWQGSFTQAAIKLDLSGPAVSKQIKALEQRLGVRLFQRTTRTISPTEAAERLYTVLLGQDGQVQALFDEWASAQIEPTGRLKLAVPMAFGERFLHRPLLHYALRYPKVTVDVEFDDRRVHLLEGGYDLALRIGALEDSGLIARRIGNCPIYLCASPDFLDAQGQPEHPDALAQLPSIVYSNAAPTWSYADAEGTVGRVTLQPHLVTNSADMIREACIAGLGLALLPAFSCLDALESGALSLVLPEYRTTPERGIYTLYPERRFVPLKVRALIDLLEAEFAEHKALR